MISFITSSDFYYLICPEHDVNCLFDNMIAPCELILCLKSGLCSKAVSKALLISAHFWETFRACKIVIKLTPGYRNKLPRCQCTVKWQLRLVPSQVQSWSDLVRILAVISGGSGTRVKRSLSYGAAQDELLSRRAAALLRNARPRSLPGSICCLKGESLWRLNHDHC